MFNLLFSLFCYACAVPETVQHTVSSPDGKLVVTIQDVGDGNVQYRVLRGDQMVLDWSALGIRASVPIGAVAITDATDVQQITDEYEQLTAKRRFNTYQANRRVFSLRDAAGRGYDVAFQVSDDGVAFKYIFEDIDDKWIIEEELTSFRFPAKARAWLQPMSTAKTGWEHTNPAYEEHYLQDMAVGTPARTRAGWVYPALFRVDTTWLVITEAALDGRYCATRLRPESQGGEYRIGFPDSREVMLSGGLFPESDGPFASPWRVLAIGSLATIVESNLGLHVAEKAIPEAQQITKPGKASWSWINSKDEFITYEEQRKYIDFAADMNWQYCLIDVNWDRKIGYDRIEELARYAKDKRVGLLLWYNSAGDWNTVSYTPKDRLLTRERRDEEFSRLHAMGIKGVKIDFFGGDGRSVIRYYQEILADAARHGLMVNFHGATLPRGWSRTYPHLMTAEAVRGFEMVTFSQADADRQPTHCTMLPFTRNLFDPMDYTPMNLDQIRTPVTRRTTSAFELATSVLFISGIQHYAESPEGMAKMPEEVKEFLRALPDTWEDVRFIDGYPGHDVVIARKAGSRWYIAGINGEDRDKTVNIDPTRFSGMTQAVMYADTVGRRRICKKDIPFAETTVTMKPNGGFVMVLN